MSEHLFYTAEARWFLPGSEKWDELLSWFTRQGRLPLIEHTDTPDSAARPFFKQERPRTDEYLLLPNCETVGAKQHQGRLVSQGSGCWATSFYPRWCCWTCRRMGEVVPETF